MPRRRALRLLLIEIFGLLLVLGLAPAGASSANISHAFHTTTSIANGSLVSLDPSQSNYIEPANNNNGSRLTGVAVASNDSLLAVDPSSSTVQVATSGTVNTLVSTLNGDIKVGDQIAVSPFDGVGMKSLSGSHVIGLTETAFSSKTAGAYQQTVHNKQGSTTQIWVGYVSVAIAIGVDNTNGGSSGPQLNTLQKFAQTLTGHTVSTLRVVMSLLIAAVAGIALITLIYASIFGSIISVGRNPLAKYAVFRTLTSVLAMAALVAAVAGLTIFWLLH